MTAAPTRSAFVARDRIARVVLVPGSTLPPIDVPPGPVYRNLHLNLYGTFTSGGTGHSTATLNPGEEWALLPRIEFLNNNVTKRRFSGEALQWYNYYKRLRRNLSPDLACNSAQTSARNIDSSLMLPFWMLGSSHPMDTAEPTVLSTNCQLQIDCAALTALSSSGGTLSASLTLDVYREFSTDYPFPLTPCTIQDDAFLPGQAAGSDIVVPLTSMGPAYRGVLISTKTAGSVADANVLTRVRVGANGTSTIYYDSQASAIRSKNLAYTQQAPQFLAAGAASATLQNPFLAPGSLISAWTYVDFLQDGRLMESIRSAGVSDLKLILSTSGTSDIRVWTERVMI